MKAFNFLLVLLSFSALPGFAQDYFWAGEEKVCLIPDPTKVCVHFEEAQHIHQLNSTRSDLTVLNNAVSTSDRAIIQFETPVVSLEAFAREISGNGKDVKSISYGLETTDGAEVWLTHRLVYAANESFQSLRFEELLAAYSEVKRGNTIGGFQFLELGSIEDVVKLSNELFETGMFRFAHPDFITPFSPNSTGQTGTSCSSPTDSLYEFQFYLDNPEAHSYLPDYPYYRSKRDVDIDAPEAWCLEKGDTSIVIAVIDEGVEWHEDLLVDSTGKSRVLQGLSLSFPGTPDGAPSDTLAQPWAHGQAIAGIIAASHNDIGVAGVAPNSKILPIQLVSLFSTISQQADAINWAWKNGADIINNSWTYDFCTDNPSFYPVVATAIDSAITYGRGGKGCPVVFASGFINDTYPETCVRYPNAISEIITVGAVDTWYEQPSYAPYGPELDLVAPSSPDLFSNVTVLDRMGEFGYNTSSIEPGLDWDNRNYSKWFSGTSTASAQVSGVIALLISTNSNLSCSDITSIVKSSAAAIPGLDSEMTGSGLLNAFDAVSMALSTLPVEWAFVQGKQAGASILLEWGTLTEQQSDKFIVQRAGENLFQSMGAVPAVGNSQGLETYHFVDNQPNPGKNYYRIRQDDIDGRFNFSEIIEVNYTPSETIAMPNVIPQGSHEIAFDLIDLENRTVNLRILDLQGKILTAKAIDVTNNIESVRMNLPRISAGMYFIQVNEGIQHVVSKRFLISQ